MSEATGATAGVLCSRICEISLELRVEGLHLCSIRNVANPARPIRPVAHVVHVGRIESRSVIRDEIGRSLEARSRIEKIPGVQTTDKFFRVAHAHLSDSARGIESDRRGFVSVFDPCDESTLPSAVILLVANAVQNEIL